MGERPNVKPLASSEDCVDPDELNVSNKSKSQGFHSANSTPTATRKSPRLKKNSTAVEMSIDGTSTHVSSQVTIAARSPTSPSSPSSVLQPKNLAASDDSKPAAKPSAKPNKSNNESRSRLERLYNYSKTYTFAIHACFYVLFADCPTVGPAEGGLGAR